MISLEGNRFFTNLMRLLCSTPDHYIQMNEEIERMYFFDRVGIDEQKGMEMLELMVKTGKIDERLWITASVIVSNDLLESLDELYAKRDEGRITIEELYSMFFPEDEKEGFRDGNYTE